MSLWFVVPFRVAVIYGGYCMYDRFYDEERRFTKFKLRAIDELVKEALEKDDNSNI